MSKSQEEQYTEARSLDHFSIFGMINRSRTFVLLFALIIQILLSGPDIGGGMIDLVTRIITLTAAIYMAADTKRHLIIGTILGIPSLILAAASHFSDLRIWDWPTMIFALLLYIFIIRLMLRKIFNATTITVDTIGMALCTYILIGTMWVLFYTPLVAIDPDAFSVPILTEGETFHTLTYFSYVTLTTLGYGDISPVSNLARNLAVIEALTGTLFLAVLISRLVGSYASKRDQ